MMRMPASTWCGQVGRVCNLYTGTVFVDIIYEIRGGVSLNNLKNKYNNAHLRLWVREMLSSTSYELTKKLHLR